MRRFASALATATLALLMHSGLLNAQQGRQLFVSPLGDDGNPGTEPQPFRTIQRAADIVNPGDTVIVEDGIYTGTTTRPGCPDRTIVCLSRGGTAEAWVTFKARNAGGAAIDGLQNTSSQGFYFRNDASYITLDGFEIRGVGLPSESSNGSAHAVFIDVGHDIVLTQLRVHDIGRSCTTTPYGLTGVFVRVPRVTITRSVFHDIGRYAQGENGCTANIAPQFDHGVYLSGSYVSAATPGASDVLLSNNVFYSIRRGWPVQLYPGSLARIDILNNTFAFPHPSRTGHIILAAGLTDSRIENNIFYQPNSAAIYYYSGVENNLRISHNLVAGATLLSGTPTNTTVSSTLLADPLLVDPMLPPAGLQPSGSSPAVSAGLTLPEVPTDFQGVPRPSGAYDLGAFQVFGAVITGTRSGSPPPR